MVGTLGVHFGGAFLDGTLGVRFCGGGGFVFLDVSFDGLTAMGLNLFWMCTLGTSGLLR